MGFLWVHQFPPPYNKHVSRWLGYAWPLGVNEHVGMNVRTVLYVSVCRLFCEGLRSLNLMTARMPWLGPLANPSAVIYVYIPMSWSVCDRKALHSTVIYCEFSWCQDNAALPQTLSGRVSCILILAQAPCEECFTCSLFRINWPLDLLCWQDMLFALRYVHLFCFQWPEWKHLNHLIFCIMVR